MNFLDLIWLIPLFPLAGAAAMLLIGKRLPNPAVSLICCGSVAASFLLSLGAVSQLASADSRVHQVIQYAWLAGMPFRTAAGGTATFLLDWGFLLDPLSSVMILVVTGIGLLIHIYSIGYMAHEGGYYRFFGYLNLFVFFMLILVLANNYGLLFVGWEGVGLCSYLLIGFYFHRKSASDAANKAFLVNRVGDAGFILAMLMILATFGSLRFVEVNAAVPGLSHAPEAIALLLFVGAAGKSAQFPLYVWLPDAMEGPTPVSALIHAATMVTAGVYMVARSGAIYAAAPGASAVVMAVGAFTAILAASIALVQNDIKRVLAYSTVSQLGYMFMAAGAGAYWVAVFHLYTHAFFKALLFLGSGSVIHAMSGEQDMQRMGGLRRSIPWTYRLMFVGSLAIAGIPGLAGFFSKDEILWEVFNVSPVVWAVGLLTAMLTAFYMWRLMFLTFHGEPRHHAHPHESPAVMLLPLGVLAAGSVGAGWIHGAFEHWLDPVLARPAAPAHAAGHSTEYVLMALSVGVAVVGIFAASRLYLRKWEGASLYRLLLNKWYVDEIYDFLFVRGAVLGGGRLLAAFDSRVVDGGVNGAGWLARFESKLSIWADTWIIDGAVRLLSFLAKAFSLPVRIVQTGQVQEYALVFVAGVAVFLLYYTLR